jgi:hypothetical protein
LARLLDGGMDDDIALQLDMEQGMDQGVAFDNAGMADSILAGFWPNDAREGEQWRRSSMPNGPPSMVGTANGTADNNWMAEEFLDMMNESNEVEPPRQLT